MSNIFDSWNSINTEKISSPVSSPTKRNNVLGSSTSIIDTDCEGYVTKQGHVVKSWRRRYLKFDGTTKTCTYFDSKTLYQNGAPPKGYFAVSSIQKQEFEIGVVNAVNHPYGFKMIGHTPGKGYHELLAFVESSADLARWYLIVSTALRKDAHKKLNSPSKSDLQPNGGVLTWFKKPNNSPKKTTTGNVVFSANKDVAKVQEKTHTYLQQAIRDAQETREIGNATCEQLVQQAECISGIETNLDNINENLTKGQTLLEEMKNPMLSLLVPKSVMVSTAPVSKDYATTQLKLNEPDPKKKKKEVSVPQGDELTQLSSILQELHVQAEAIGSEVDRSNEQLSRIEAKVEVVNARLQEQTKTAEGIATKGTVW